MKQGYGKALMYQALSPLRALMKSSSKKSPCENLCSVFHALFSFTCTNDLFNLDTGNVDLLGKLSDCFIGVFICEGVDVDLHSW